MTKMHAEFDPQAVVEALETHRENINEGMWKQMLGDDTGALQHAIDSINLLTKTLFDLLGEDNRRELRQLTVDTKDVATYFDLDDDEDFAAEFDRQRASA